MTRGPPRLDANFRVEFPCGHTECSDTHVLLIDVQPFDHIVRLLADVAWTSHMASAGNQPVRIESIPADASAAFGINPDVTYCRWVMVPAVALRTYATGRQRMPTNFGSTAGNIIRGCS